MKTLFERLKPPIYLLLAGRSKNANAFFGWGPDAEHYPHPLPKSEVQRNSPPWEGGPEIPKND